MALNKQTYSQYNRHRSGYTTQWWRLVRVCFFSRRILIEINWRFDSGRIFHLILPVIVKLSEQRTAYDSKNWFARRTTTK